MFAERLLTLIPCFNITNASLVHGHFYLKEYKLKIHLNGRNRTCRKDTKLSVVNIHSLDEVKERKSVAIMYFMSPVFNSISKLNYNSAYTAEELRTAAKAGIIDKKVIALEGIDEKLAEWDFGFGEPPY